jgi:hypothetical protein
MTPNEWTEQQDREQVEYLREWNRLHPWRSKHYKLAGVIDILALGALILLVWEVGRALWTR